MFRALKRDDKLDDKLPSFYPCFNVLLRELWDFLFPCSNTSNILQSTVAPVKHLTARGWALAFSIISINHQWPETLRISTTNTLRRFTPVNTSNVCFSSIHPHHSLKHLDCAEWAYQWPDTLHIFINKFHFVHVVTVVCHCIFLWRNGTSTRRTAGTEKLGCHSTVCYHHQLFLCANEICCL